MNLFLVYSPDSILFGFSAKYSGHILRRYICHCWNNIYYCRESERIMSNVPFEFYGHSSGIPPELHLPWNEQKRIVDLNHNNYVFITSLYSSPWRQRERFPNANKCTLFYYWSKYSDKRVKDSLHWITENSRWPRGSTKSRIFGQTYARY